MLYVHDNYGIFSFHQTKYDNNIFMFGNFTNDLQCWLSIFQRLLSFIILIYLEIRCCKMVSRYHFTFRIFWSVCAWSSWWPYHFWSVCKTFTGIITSEKASKLRNGISRCRHNKRSESRKYILFTFYILYLNSKWYCGLRNGLYKSVCFKWSYLKQVKWKNKYSQDKFKKNHINELSCSS